MNLISRYRTVLYISSTYLSYEDVSFSVWLYLVELGETTVDFTINQLRDSIIEEIEYIK